MRRPWLRSLLRKPVQAWPGWPLTGGAVLAGLALALGDRPFGLWPVALVGLAAGLWLMARPARPGAAAWVGFAFGLGHFALVLDWIVQPFFVDPVRDGWMAPFGMTGMAGGMALFWMLAAGVAAFAPRWRMLALATAFSTVELARCYVLTGFPWAQPGQVLIGTPLMQLAALVGANGLTAFTIFAAAGLARLRPVPVALGLAALAAGWAWGTVRLAAPAPAAPGVHLRLVQPNVPELLKWDAALAADHFARLLRETAAPPAPGAPRPDLVIWPETALPYSVERDPGVVGIIVRAAQGAAVAVGRQRIVGTRGWNTLTVYDPQGRQVASYDKHHLVPFGEYVPLGDLAYTLFGLRAFAAQTGHAFTAGPGPRVLDLGAKLGRVEPLICYEAVFPQDVREVPTRPDWLMQVTNDAWFGTYSGPFQHAAQAQLRAVEAGLPLIRVANTGLTEVIDARGRVLEGLPFDTMGHLDAQLPGKLPAPPYWHWGEGPLILWLAGCAGLAFWPRRRRAA